MQITEIAVSRWTLLACIPGLSMTAEQLVDTKRTGGKEQAAALLETRPHDCQQWIVLCQLLR